MPRLTHLLPLALATLSAAALQAQADPAGQTSSPTQPPAPIVRSSPADPATAPPPPPGSDALHPKTTPATPYQGNYMADLAAGQTLTATKGIANVQPITGVYLRIALHAAVQEVSTTPQRTEFRVVHGIANVSVNHPEDGMLILVDLPGGQVQLLKNGLYTFNAGTDVERTLEGEAKAFGAGASANAKPTKVKESNAIIFPPTGSAVSKLKAHEFEPFQVGRDLIPQPFDENGDDGSAYAQDNSTGSGDGGYGVAGPPVVYGGGLYDPYYAWGGMWNPFWDGFGGGYGFGLGFGYGAFGYGGWGYPGFGYGGFYGGRWGDGDGDRFGGRYGGYGDRYGGGRYGGGRYGGARPGGVARSGGGGFHGGGGGHIGGGGGHGGGGGGGGHR